LIKIERKNVPLIRFKSFGDGWRSMSLKENLLSCDYGLNASAKKFDGINKYLRITDIDEQSRKFVKDSLSSPDCCLEDKNHYILKERDLLFARTGASVGKTYLYNKADGHVYFAGFLIRLRLTRDINELFVFQSTLTDNYKNFVKITSQRSGQPGINAKEYGSLILNIPTLPEQTQIGNFFKTLDEQISLQEQKHQKLINLKKAMLEKMFPKEGADVPEIRFKGFTDKWEVKKLGDKVEFYNGLTYSPGNIKDSNHTLVLRSSNVKNSQIVLNDNVFVDNNVINSDNVQKGDIVVVVRNGSRNLIGKHAQIKHDMPNTVIGAFMTGVRYKIPNFLNALLDSNKFIIEIEKNLGATINQITTGAFKSMLFKFPTAEEQQKIGDYFENLNQLIQQSQTQLDKYKNIKQALLQKMFV